MNPLFILGGLFFCHYLGDYTFLSRPFMLKAKATGSPVWPIFIHACIHGLLMLLLLLCVMTTSTWSLIPELILIQVLTHFAIDVWKGMMNVWFPILKHNTKYPHWTIFGLDQLLHTFVILFMYHLITKP